MKLSLSVIKHPYSKYKDLPLTAKAAVWFLFCNFFQKSIAALSTPIFTRLLSTAEFGKVNIFYSWADVLGIFITFGLSSAVYSRGLVKNENCKNDYTSSMIGLSLTTAILSFCLVITIKTIFLKNLDMTTISLLGVYLYVFFNTITEFWYQQKRTEYDYFKTP